MAKQNQSSRVEDLVQKIVIEVEERFSGSMKAVEYLSGIQKEYAKSTKAGHKFAKDALVPLEKSLALNNKGAKENAKHMRGLAASYDVVRRKTMHVVTAQKNVTRSTRETTNAIKQQTRAIKASGWGLGRLAQFATAGFLIKKIGDIAATRFQTATLAGPDILKQIQQAGGSIPADKSFALINSLFQNQSARFSLAGSPQAIKGMLAIQEQMAGVGLDFANSIITQLSESFGGNTARRQRFFEALGGGSDIRSVLSGFTNQGNVGAFSTALAALDITRDPQQDPILQEAMQINNVVQSMDITLTKIAESLTSIAVPLTKNVLPLLNSASGFARKHPALTGLGIAGAVAAPGLAGGILAAGGRGMAGALGGAGSLAIANPGIAAIAAAAAGSAIVGNEAIKTYKQYQKQSEAFYHAGGIAEMNHAAGARRYANAATEQERLKAQRQMLNAQMGLTPSMSKESRMRISQQIQDINNRLKDMRAKGHGDGRGIFSEGLDKLKSAANSSIGGIKSLVDSMNQFAEVAKRAGQERKLQALQEKFLAQQAAIQRYERVSSLTDLRRMEFQLSSMTPFGPLGAMGQFQNLMEQLNSEISSLQGILQSIDTSTHEGMIESNRIKAEIVKRRLEARQQTLFLRDAQLSSVLSMATAAGRFEKIIFQQEKNAMRALNSGIFTGDYASHLGNVDPSRPSQTPMTADQVAAIWGVDNPYRMASAAANQKRSTPKTNQPGASDASKALRKMGNAAHACADEMQRQENEKNDVSPSPRYRRFGPNFSGK